MGVQTFLVGLKAKLFGWNIFSNSGSIRSFNTVCITLSIVLGIPRGLIFPFAFGMKILLVGLNSNVQSVMLLRSFSNFINDMPSRV